MDEDDEFDIAEIERIEREYLERKSRAEPIDESSAKDDGAVGVPVQPAAAAEAKNGFPPPSVKEPLEEDIEDDILLAAMDAVENGAGPEKLPSSKHQSNVDSKEHRSQVSITNFFGQSTTADSFSSGRQPKKKVTSLEWPTEVVVEDLVPDGMAPDEDLRSWIYPSNLPEREYQFEMVRSCLVANTLVCLPTGLGKTFIAAVVMYNFWRWFPRGKIVFVAPTRPLVRQQIQACYDITGLPSDQTIELTGATHQKKRTALWEEKRVFFLTPQVMTNDLARGDCPAGEFVLIVLDEAHRATKNYAYCGVVSKVMQASGGKCRTVGLSATPGNNLSIIQDVIHNIRSSLLEFRDEKDEDVSRYINKKDVQTITVQLSPEILEVREDAVDMLRLKMGLLAGSRAAYMPPDLYNINPFVILSSRDRWRARKDQNLSWPEKRRLESIFLQAISLCYGISILYSHGLGVFSRFLEQQVYEVTEQKFKAKAELVYSERFQRLKSKADSMVAEGKSHPKQVKCEECLVEHFKGVEESKSSRAIIFVEFRESVAELEKVLQKHDPLVRVVSFVGQNVKSAIKADGKSTTASARGMKQKDQNKVLRMFRAGTYNTLVSTSIGEEGLDIGEVDLIITYDALKSPVRLIQRMGRTGRKRAGRVVSLLTDGAEVARYISGNQTSDLIKDKLRRDKFKMYRKSARMLPVQVGEVQCRKVSLTISAVKFGKVEEDMSQHRERKQQVAANRANEVISRRGIDGNSLRPSRSLASILKDSLRSSPTALRIPSPFGFIRHSEATNELISLLQKMEEIEILPTQQVEEMIHTARNTETELTVRDESSSGDVEERFDDSEDFNVFPELSQQSADRGGRSSCQHRSTGTARILGLGTPSDSNSSELGSVDAPPATQFVDGSSQSVSERTEEAATLVMSQSVDSGDEVRGPLSGSNRQEDGQSENIATPPDEGLLFEDDAEVEAVMAPPPRTPQKRKRLIQEINSQDSSAGLPSLEKDRPRHEPVERESNGNAEPRLETESRKQQEDGQPLKKKKSVASRKRVASVGQMVEDEAEASSTGNEEEDDYTTSLDGFLVHSVETDQNRTPMKSNETPTGMYRRSLINSGEKNRAINRAGRQLEEKIRDIAHRASTRPGKRLNFSQSEEDIREDDDHSSEEEDLDLMQDPLEHADSLPGGMKQEKKATGTGNPSRIGTSRGSKKRKLRKMDSSQSTAQSRDLDSPSPPPHPVRGRGDVLAPQKSNNTSAVQMQPDAGNSVRDMASGTGEIANAAFHSQSSQDLSMETRKDVLKSTPKKIQDLKSASKREGEIQQEVEALLLRKQAQYTRKQESRSNNFWKPNAQETVKTPAITVIVSSKHVSSPIIRELTSSSSEARCVVWKLGLEDFVVGNEHAVLKRSILDIVKSHDVVESLLIDISTLQLKYSRITLVLQGPPDRFAKSPKYIKLLSALDCFNRGPLVVRLRVGSSVEDLAPIIRFLAIREIELGEDLHWLPLNADLRKRSRQASFFEANPRVSWPTAFSLITSFPTAREILNADEQELVSRSKGMSDMTAKSLVSTFRR